MIAVIKRQKSITKYQAYNYLADIADTCFQKMGKTKHWKVMGFGTSC